MQKLTTSFHISVVYILGIATLFFATLFTFYPVLMIIMSLVIITLLVLIIKPGWSYFLLILSYHCSYLMTKLIHEKIDYFYTPGEILLVVMFFLWFVSRSINTVAPYPKTACDIPLLLFVSLALLSLFWSHDFYYGVDQMLRLFFVSIGSLVLALSIINTHSIINKIIWFIIIIGVVDSIICFFALYTYPDYPATNLYKAKDFQIYLMFNMHFVGKRGHAFCHPLTTALWLNIALILSFGKFITTKGNIKILIGIIMFLLLTAQLTTMGKGPVIAIIGGFVFLFLFIKPLKKAFFISIIILFVTIVTSFVLANITQLKKVSAVTAHQMTYGDEDSSTSSRTRWWSTGIKKGLETYGLGVGIGGIRKYLYPRGVPHTHNVYVGAFAELGFIGLSLLLLIYFITFKTCFEALRQCKSEYYKRILLAYMGGFVMLLIDIATDSNYVIDLIWWYIGFGLALAKFAKEAPHGYMEENLPFFEDGKSICATVK